MNKPPLLITLVVLLIIIFATRQYFNQRKQDAENRAAPIRNLQVVVTAKREFLTNNRRSRQREVIPVEEMSYEVYFRPLTESRDIKLTLTPQDYHQIDKGVKGTLCLQGTRFISFIPAT